MDVLDALNVVFLAVLTAAILFAMAKAITSWPPDDDEDDGFLL